MPATQALWKAEIKEIMAPVLSSQKHLWDSHLNGKKHGGLYLFFQRWQELRPYLQNNQSKKGYRAWLKWESTCQEHTKPWIQTLVLVPDPKFIVKLTNTQNITQYLN
jgi:hypothetical protein